MANLTFTADAIFWGVGFIFLGIVALILGLRYYYGRNAQENLARGPREADLQGDFRTWLKNRNKYENVNTFQGSQTLLHLGIVIALVLTFLAFNWMSTERKIEIPQDALVLDMDLEVEIPRSAEPPPPPPPPPPPTIEAVPDDLTLVEDEVTFQDQSVDATFAVTEAPVPVAAPEKKAAPPPPPPPPPAEARIAEIFKVVEEMPRFPGCEDLPTIAEKKACADKKMLEFIYSQIEYPQIARENGVEGMVVVRFVVDEDGKISAAEILREPGAGLGDEAIRIVNLMNDMPERWLPGRQRGKPVKVYFNLPVKFILKRANP